MQGINFGRIEGLRVADGDPVFEPMPRVVRQVKFCAEHQPRPEKEIDDFRLKNQVVEMFDVLTRLGDGTVECLEIKHGLPFLMNVEETVKA
jgi:hypothetical protein